MKMYITATGQYARTKDEAGKGHTAVEVPTDARGLVAYLNEVRPAFPRPAEAPVSPVQSLGDDPALLADQRDDEVPDAFEPRTAFSPPAAAPQAHATQADIDAMFTPPTRGQALLLEGRELDAISDRIMTSQGWQLSKLIGACVDRMSELARGLA